MKWKFIAVGFLAGIAFCVVSFFIFSIFLFGDIESKIAKAGHSKVDERFLFLTDSLTVIPLKTPEQVDIISTGAGGLIVLNFWATWCGPCKKEMPSFKTLIEKTGPGVKFYFLSDEPFEKQQLVIQKAGWSLPFFKIDNAILKRFTTILPTTYIIKNGVVVLKQEGELDWGSPKVIDFVERIK